MLARRLVVALAAVSIPFAISADAIACMIFLPTYRLGPTPPVDIGQQIIARFRVYAADSKVTLHWGRSVMSAPFSMIEVVESLKGTVVGEKFLAETNLPCHGQRLAPGMEGYGSGSISIAKDKDENIVEILSLKTTAYPR